MKRCPECRRDYLDDSLLYCLEDGAALVQGSVPSPDEPATAILPDTAAHSEAATRVQVAMGEKSQLRTSNSTTRVGSQISRSARLLILAAVAIGIFLGGFFGYRYFGSSDEQIESIAVLPFQNRSDDADTDYLTDGIAESLIFRLTQLPGLKVSPASSVMRYKGSEADIAKVASALGVDAVMTGRLMKRGDSVSLTVELVDARSNISLWGAQYERKMSELLATQREIADAVADKLRPRPMGGEKEPSKRYTNSNEAYELYLRGRYEWNKFTFDGLTKSITLFERAIEIDPSYAMAYSGLADSYINLGIDYVRADETMPKARVAAMQAIALDSSLAEAHTSLASYKLFYEWDTSGADEGYRKAIGLDGRYAAARHFSSHSLQFSGREAEALREMRTAVELEPLSLVNNAELGWALYLANQYDAAIEQARKTIELEPSFAYAYFVLGQAYAAKGNYAEALAAFRETQRLSPDWLEVKAELAYTSALAGDRREAQALLAKLLEYAAKTYVNPVHIAAVYAALSDNDQAIAWLERGYDEKCSWMKWIAIEPQLERLRPDPRFQDLVRRVDKK